MWTVYHPRPPLNSHTAKCFEIGPDSGEPRMLDDTVIGSYDAIVQNFIDQGLYRMPASPGDDPSIIETWF